MSALPPKADIIERDWHVRFVPKADIAGSVDHLICGQHHAHRHFKSERLRCLEADDEFILSRKLDRQIAGSCSLENAIDVISCTAKLVGKIEGVTHEPTGIPRSSPVSIRT